MQQGHLLFDPLHNCPLLFNVQMGALNHRKNAEKDIRKLCLLLNLSYKPA